MFAILKRFKVQFAFILAVLVISFNGSYDSERDIDVIEAQKFIDANRVPIQSYQTVTPISKSSPVLVVLNSGALPNHISVTLPNPFSAVDTTTILAHPGPANNGGSANWAMFLDLIAGPRDITVTQMSTANTGTASQSFTVEVFTRVGTALGGPVSSGPGSSPAGWTSIGTVPAVQGAMANGVSLVFTLPNVVVTAGDTVGVAIKFSVVGPRYFGTGTPPLSMYSDTNLVLITGEGRSAPFTPTGSWFSSRALNGLIRYVVSTTTGIINTNTEIPGGFNLAQNYPNPFNPSTTMEFAIPDRSKVTLKVYNAHGQEVTTLANEEYSPGTYRVRWDAASFASGVYFYSMQAGNFSQTKKLLLVK